MSEDAFSSSPTSHLFRPDIKGVEILVELALDLRWSWNHCTDDIWQQLDPALWARTQNPWIVLQTVSRERLRGALADPVFVKTLDDLVQSERRATEAPAWFHTAHTGSGLTRVAYFSMEFMLGGALPIYSGGLGNVAGDQLKSASDLGVPLVGVGLLYQQGYFRQVIDRDGAQPALFPYNDPGQLPITPLRQPDGWLETTENLEQDIRRLPDARLWALRTAGRQHLVEYARGRLSEQLASAGASHEAVEEAKCLFDPRALTLDFARRFATYKRPNLLLRDSARLLRLLSDRERPVQLILAGKAHPADQAGRALIQEWTRFIGQSDTRTHVIFLSDYDTTLSEINERPVIFALSNPTANSECTAEQAYAWSNGRAIFASGSPFGPVGFQGQTFVPGQANNAYIFPGLGLGVISSRARRVTDEMFLTAARTLASHVSDGDLVQGRVFPPLGQIRQISVAIAAAVAGLAYERHLASEPEPADLRASIEALMYQPAYEPIR